MFVPFLIAGLILVIAGHSWFAAAAAVGWILIAVSAVMVVVTLAILGGIGWIARETTKGTRR